jgi:hypothetical protein
MPAVQAKDEELQDVFGFGEGNDWTRFNCDTLCWMYFRDKHLFDGPQKRPKLFKSCAEEFLTASGPLAEPVARMQKYLEANPDIGWDAVSVTHQHLKQRAKFWRLKSRTKDEQEELLRMVRSGSYSTIGPTPPNEGVTTRSMSKAPGQTRGLWILNHLRGSVELMRVRLSKRTVSR